MAELGRPLDAGDVDAVSPDLFIGPSPLERIAHELEQLHRFLAHRPLNTLRRRLLITASENPVDFSIDNTWHSLLIENPNAAVVEVAFSSGKGLPGKSHRRVPGDTGLMIVESFKVVSIGFDPAAIGGGLEVFVTLYDRPQVATSYVFNP